MKHFGILLLVLFGLVFAKQTSLSLYYYGDTTFINLPLPSRPSQLSFEFESYSRVGNYETEEVLKVLQGKNIQKVSNGYLISGTALGNVLFNTTLLQTSFFHSPNGEKERQGWILTKEQYPSEDYLLGATPYIKLLSKTVDLFGFRQNAIRVNVEIPLNASLIRDLMINLYREENRMEIIHENNFKLESEYSNGFKNILLQKDDQGRFIYQPTMDQLYDDFIIRQGMELQFPHELDIWSQSLDILRSRFLELKDYSHPSFGLDITPILLHHRRDDLVSLKLSSFVNPSASIQFREFKGKPLVAVRRSVGIVKATELYGVFIADSAISQISFIELSVIRQIRSYVKSKKKILFKYIVWNSETCPNIYQDYHQKTINFYTKVEKFILGHIETAIFGYAPFIIPGNSVVWHQRQEHRFNILGKYNPSLINLNIAHFLENKWFEYMYFENYCPNFFPKSKLLFNLLPGGVNRFDVAPELVSKLANEHFPNGWILKGVWDYNGIEHVITHKTNIVKEFHKYKSSNFDQIYEIKKKNLVGCEPIEDINDALKNNTHFIGFKIGTLLKDSAHTFLQEYQQIEREYRIECVSGYCPMEAMNPDTELGYKDSKTTEHLYRKSVNDFFMKCINSLPEILRGIPLTADPAILKGGRFVTFETNPGGNGWLIHNELKIAKEHNKVMKKYIQMFEEDSMDSPLHRGMKLEEEIKYLTHMMKVWNVSLPIHAKKFENILPDRILDSEHSLTEIKMDRLNYNGPQLLTPKIVSKEIKKLSIQKAFSFLHQNSKKFLKDEPFDFIHSIAQFSILKKSIPDRTSVESLQIIVQSLQNEDGKTIVDNQVKKLKKFEVKMPLDQPLNETMTKKLASMITRSVELLEDLQILDIEHEELRTTLHRFYDILFNQNLNNWNSMLIGSFDVLGVSKFNLWTELLKSQITMDEGLKKITPILSKFTEVLSLVHSLDRTGFKFPGFSFQSLLNIWVPSIRSLYKILIFDDKTLKEKEIYQEAFTELSYVVSRLIITFSDHSLFRLPKQNFDLEFQFLKEAARISSFLEETFVNNEILSALRILGGETDPYIKKSIEENQFNFVLKQQKKGSWNIDDKIDINSMDAGITSLIDHDNSIELDIIFPRIAPFEDYQKRLNEDGLMLKKIEFYSNKSKHPNNDNIHDQVKKTFRLFSLETQFQVE
jgi:hypothetical protein